jgi:peroxiredoxin
MLRTLENPFRERISEVINRRNNLTDSLDRSVCDTINKILKREIEELDRLWSSLQKKIDSIQVTFVLENPHTFSSVICLRDLQGNEIIPPDSVKNMFSRLDNSLRNSTYGKYIHEDIRKNENMRIGSQAPEFKATDINQQTVTLSQFKGKSVVLLDFWASWCVPCRKTIPHLKTVFNKYHPLGLEIVAVSTDLNRSQWIAAIKEDRTDLWYHIPVAEKYSEGVFSSFDIYQNYFISSIPTTILVDRDGYIIGQIKGYSKRNEEILDSLLTSLFGN